MDHNASDVFNKSTNYSVVSFIDSNLDEVFHSAENSIINHNNIEYWLLIPFLLCLLGTSFHITSCRVLYLVSVKHRFGRPSAEDLHHVLLTVSLNLLLHLVSLMGVMLETFTFTSSASGTICVISSAGCMIFGLLLRCMVVFLALRVAFNRVLFRVHYIYTIVVSVACVLFGVTDIIVSVYPKCHWEPIDPLIDIVYAVIGCIILATALLCWAGAAVAVRARRRKIGRTDLINNEEVECVEEYKKESRSQFDPEVEQKEASVSEEAVVKEAANAETVAKRTADDEETLTSLDFVHRVENLALAISGVLCAAFMSDGVISMLRNHTYFSYFMWLSVSILAETGSGFLYLVLYPGFRGYAKRSFWCQT